MGKKGYIIYITAHHFAITVQKKAEVNYVQDRVYPLFPGWDG